MTIRERDTGELRYVVRKRDGVMGFVICTLYDGYLYVDWDSGPFTFIHPNGILWIRPATRRIR